MTRHLCSPSIDPGHRRDSLSDPVRTSWLWSKFTGIGRRGTHRRCTGRVEIHCHPSPNRHHQHHHRPLLFHSIPAGYSRKQQNVPICVVGGDDLAARWQYCFCRFASQHLSQCQHSVGLECENHLRQYCRRHPVCLLLQQLVSPHCMPWFMLIRV